MKAKDESDVTSAEGKKLGFNNDTLRGEPGRKLLCVNLFIYLFIYLLFTYLFYINPQL